MVISSGTPRNMNRTIVLCTLVRLMHFFQRGGTSPMNHLKIFFPGVTFITQIPVVRPIKICYYPPIQFEACTYVLIKISKYHSIIRRRTLFFSSLIFRGEGVPLTFMEKWCWAVHPLTWLLAIAIHDWCMTWQISAYGNPSPMSIRRPGFVYYFVT